MFFSVVSTTSETKSKHRLSLPLIKDSIDSACVNFKDYVLKDSAFTRSRKWTFNDYVNHIIFNTRKTVTNNIFMHLKYSTGGAGSYTKQSFSSQRVNIDPDIFKKINLNYLRNIGYLGNDSSTSLFKTFKGFRLFAGDGSKFDIPDKKLTLNEFGFPKDYSRAPKVVFSGVVDVLNGFLIDGIMGKRGVGERKLMHQNLINCEKLIKPESSIFIFDRGYPSIELYARIILMKSYFVVRLPKNFYNAEREDMKSDDHIIHIDLSEDKIKPFLNPVLKKWITNKEYLTLRAVNIKLETGEIETLITNLPQEMMSLDDLNKIYDTRWGIESSYKTMKQRLEIENYTAYTQIGILQDIYSTFIMYNIYSYSKIYLDIIINKNMRKKGKTNIYQVNQSNLISRLKIDLFELIFDPPDEFDLLEYLIEKCLKLYHIVEKSRKYERRTKKTKTRIRTQYKPTF